MYKEPLVFLPGMMCDMRLFEHQLINLAVGRSVIFATITQGATICEIAKSVLRDTPAKFALAGLSLDGIVAMEILRLAPERLTKLALMDTNPLAETPQAAADREPQIIKAKKGQMLEVTRDEMKPSYFAPRGKRKEVLNVVMDMALKLGPDVFIRQSRALQKRLDQQATLRGAKLNTLVLCGEFDSLCPPKRHQLMKELIPDARLKVIENAGHPPTLEQPSETTEVMHEWLSQP